MGGNQHPLPEGDSRAAEDKQREHPPEAEAGLDKQREHPPEAEAGLDMQHWYKEEER